MSRTEIERYADRGTPRGADTVLAAARAHGEGLLPDYPTTQPVSAGGSAPGAPSWPRRVVAAAVAVGAVALGARVLDGPLRTDDRDPVPPTATVEPAYPPSWTDEMIAGAEEIERQLAGGGTWVRWQGGPADPGTVVPAEAWVWVGAGIGGVRQDPCGCRIPVYDAPDGEIIGYHVFDSGFVPADGAAPSTDTTRG